MDADNVNIIITLIRKMSVYTWMLNRVTGMRKKNPTAVELGRRGGRARVKRMTAEQLRDSESRVTRAPSLFRGLFHARVVQMAGR